MGSKEAPLGNAVHGRADFGFSKRISENPRRINEMS